jgi:hypothetical protein
MVNLDKLKIHLSQEELDILHGAQGPILQKVMETVVLYGEALEADRLVDIEGPGHFVIPWSSPGIPPPIELLEKLAGAGLKTKFPFTLDPKPPFDFENLFVRPKEGAAIEAMYGVPAALSGESMRISREMKGGNDHSRIYKNVI